MNKYERQCTSTAIETACYHQDSGLRWPHGVGLPVTQSHFSLLHLFNYLFFLLVLFINGSLLRVWRNPGCRVSVAVSHQGARLRSGS